MKKSFKVITIILVALVVLLITVPFLFKGKIIEVVKQEANKSLNATLNFGDVHLSLFRSFPDFSLGLDNLSITGVGKFGQDTLVYVPKFRLTLDLMGVIQGNYKIKAVNLNNPSFKIRVLKDGKANYDIVKPSSDSMQEGGDDEPSIVIAIQRFKISNGILVYNDASIPMSFEAYEVDYEMSGDLSADFTDIENDLSIGKLTADYDGIRYLNQAEAKLVTKLGADLNTWKFDFPDAKLRVNALELNAKGYFAMPENGYDMDIQFEAPGNDFKHFLSLIPAVYSKDFASIEAKGSLALKGYVKGLYSDNSMPAFGVHLEITDAMFRYPDLPQAVQNIQMLADIDNKTGDPDATIIDVKKLHLEVDQNPLEASIYVSTPVSDPFVDAKITGKFQLDDVQKFYPLAEGDKLAGLVDLDVTAKGELSAIEQKRFNDFEASGHIDATNVDYRTSSLPEGLKVSRASLTLSPNLAELPVLNATLGKNDISANGKIENMLVWVFGKGDLQGNINLTSSYFNLNDFMTENKVETNGSDTGSMSVIEIPEGLDLAMNARFDHVIFDNMDLRNATGILKIKDKQLLLENLNFNTLDGKIQLDGVYSTKEIEKPVIDFSLNIQDVDVQQAFKTFNTIQKLAPIAESASGKISIQLKLNTGLDKTMMPVYETLNGSGRLTSPKLTLSGVNSLNKVADALKMDKLKQWSIDNINLSFEILDGKVFVQPFETKVGNINTNISGWNSFDQTMEYKLGLSIPRSEFGGAANSVLENLVSKANSKGANFSLGDIVPVGVLISGTVSNPKITTDLGNRATNVVDDMKQQLNETIQQKKEEAETRIREEADKYIEEANAQAQKLMEEAQSQADKLMRTANKSAEDVRAEAAKRADQILAEGKKNGPIAEIAAKKASQKVRTEGDEAASKLVQEAQKQSDGILSKARKESDKIIQNARDKAAGK